MALINWIKSRIRAVRNLNAEKLEEQLNTKIVGRELSELLVYLMLFIYTAVFSYFTIFKHYAFRSYAWDLGISTQALWTTLNKGRFFYYTPELFYNTTGSYFGLHFSPILFLLLPIYAIYQTPETLLIFQSFIIALATIPLYYFVRDSLKSKFMAVGFSLFYLLYPPIQSANWFDFHVQSFLPLIFFSTMYFLEHEKWKKYFVCIIFALAVAESVCIVVAFIGLYELLKYRKPLLQTFKQRTLKDKKVLVPLITITIAIAFFLFGRLIQNTFFPIDPKFSNFYRAVDYWSVLGTSGDPVIMPLYIIINPLKVLEALAYDAYLKLLFVVLIFGSLLFLPLRSSIVLVTLASLGPALLSNYQPFYTVGTHYPLYYIPFVLLAAVDGMKKQNHGRNFMKFSGYVRNLLVVVIIFALFASPLSPLLFTSEISVPHFSEYIVPSIGPHEYTLQRMVNLVPQNASILTQNHLFPQFSSRLNAYVYPLPQAFKYAPKEMNDYTDQLLMNSDYILIDTKYDKDTADAMLEKIHFYCDSFRILKYEDGVYLYVKRMHSCGRDKWQIYSTF